MRELKIKAVVITDGEHYIMHGTDTSTPAEMFKAMAPVWNFDPSRETAHFVEVTVKLEEKEKLVDAPVTE